MIPTDHQIIMLCMRVDCLAGAVKKALESGDIATAARLNAELIDAASEVRRLAEKAQYQ